MAVSPRARKPRVDVGLAAATQLSVPRREPIDERAGASQFGLAAAQSRSLQRRLVALSAVAAQNGPVRERPQRRLAVVDKQELLDPTALLRPPSPTASPRTSPAARRAARPPVRAPNAPRQRPQSPSASAATLAEPTATMLHLMRHVSWNPATRGTNADADQPAHSTAKRSQPTACRITPTSE